jgi:hypothetical protein
MFGFKLAFGAADSPALSFSILSCHLSTPFRGVFHSIEANQARWSPSQRVSHDLCMPWPGHHRGVSIGYRRNCPFSRKGILAKYDGETVPNQNGIPINAVVCRCWGLCRGCRACRGVKSLMTVPVRPTPSNNSYRLPNGFNVNPYNSILQARSVSTRLFPDLINYTFGDIGHVLPSGSLASMFTPSELTNAFYIFVSSNTLWLY